MSQSRQNLQKDEQKDGWMDRPCFIGTCWPRPGVQQASLSGKKKKIISATIWAISRKTNDPTLRKW